MAASLWDHKPVVSHQRADPQHLEGREHFPHPGPENYLQIFPRTWLFHHGADG